jgi:hypothetical protein
VVALDLRRQRRRWACWAPIRIENWGRLSHTLFRQVQVRVTSDNVIGNRKLGPSAPRNTLSSYEGEEAVAALEVSGRV